MSTKKAQTKKLNYKTYMANLDAKEKKRILTLSAVLNTISSISKIHNVNPRINTSNLSQSVTKYNIPEKTWALDYDYMTFDPAYKPKQPISLKSPHKQGNNRQLSKKNRLQIKKGVKQGRGGKKNKTKKNARTN